MLHRNEDTEDVDLEGAAEIVERVLGDRKRAAIIGSGFEWRVDASVFRPHIGSELRDRRFIGSVDRRRLVIIAIQGSCDRLERRAVEINQHQTVALIGKLLGDGRTQIAGSPSHNAHPRHAAVPFSVVIF